MECSVLMRWKLTAREMRMGNAASAKFTGVMRRRGLPLPDFRAVWSSSKECEINVHKRRTLVAVLVPMKGEAQW